MTHTVESRTWWPFVDALVKLRKRVLATSCVSARLSVRPSARPQWDEFSLNSILEYFWKNRSRMLKFR